MEQIVTATGTDRDEIARLLDACSLPSSDIDAHLGRFFVARDDGRLVGCIGIEHAGNGEGLLRSLAVAPEHRGHGIARRLYARVIAQARQLGISQLYLLTTGAEPFFEMLGFRAVPREQVPASIQSTQQFRSQCPASARCLSRPVPRAD